jgi:hypothetical protein
MNEELFIEKFRDLVHGYVHGAGDETMYGETIEAMGKLFNVVLTITEEDCKNLWKKHDK